MWMVPQSLWGKGWGGMVEKKKGASKKRPVYIEYGAILWHLQVRGRWTRINLINITLALINGQDRQMHFCNQYFQRFLQKEAVFRGWALFLILQLTVSWERERYSYHLAALPWTRCHREMEAKCTLPVLPRVLEEDVWWVCATRKPSCLFAYMIITK